MEKEIRFIFIWFFNNNLNLSLYFSGFRIKTIVDRIIGF
jgi:hypothetical protein